MKEDKLYQVLELYNEAMVDSYKPLEKETDHKFTQKFERKMNALVRRQKKPYYFLISTPKRRAAVIAILVAILMLTACSILPVRDFIIKVYKEGTTLIFNDSKHSEESGEFEKAYIEIPDGYKVEELSYDPYFIKMRNGNNLITFQQSGVQGLQLDVDTEGTTHENITINGFDGIYVYNKNYHLFVWSDGCYAYTLSSAQLSKEELLQMAETVRVGNESP